MAFGSLGLLSLDFLPSPQQQAPNRFFCARTSIPIKRLLAVHGVNMPTEEAGGGNSGTPFQGLGVWGLGFRV